MTINLRHAALSCAILACMGGSTLAQPPADTAAPHDTAPLPGARETAMRQLAYRLLGNRVDDFTFVIDPSLQNEATRRIGIIRTPEGKIRISGADTISLASGLNLYLKHFAHAHVSWVHDQLHLPKELPGPDKIAYFDSRQQHATAFNYCTFNYTMAWWDWPRWERELDLLCLYGVDTPLAIIGTEEIWLRVLQRFGYTRDEARTFPAGPAYTAWWLMGNCQGIGGPVSEAYVQSRVELQKKILARMRELGMRPILQGFVGLVPLDFADKNPGARLLPQGNWCGVPRPPVLHPDDPLFGRIAEAWYEEQAELYGNNSRFAGDLFHEGGNSRGIDVPRMAAKVQALMLRSHPDAVWMLQGWGGNPSPALLKGLDPEHAEVVELCGEFFRNWEKNNGFSGTPWYLSTIVQYGGNIGLHGRLPAIWHNFLKANRSGTPPIGIGLTWESTGVNPVVADLVTELPWNRRSDCLETWIGHYADRRYGAASDGLRQAWLLLLRSAYGEFPNHRRPTESIFCARPGTDVRKVSPFAASVQPPYNVDDIRKALELLYSERARCGHTPAYRHDLVDVARQFLAGFGLQAYRTMMQADARKDLQTFDKQANLFLSLLDMQDRLLASEKDFMLGPWLQAARDIAPQGEHDRFERQARNLVSVWFPDGQPSSLADYGWREWSGLLSHYCKPRWQEFIAYRRALLEGKQASPPDFAAMEKNWALQTTATDSYPLEPSGDSIAIVGDIVRTWMPLWEKSGYRPPDTTQPAPEESANEAR